MDEFYAALWTWWATQSADNFYVGIGGRFRADEARQNDVKPYAILTQVDGLPEYFQDGDYDELAHLEFQIDIYSETSLEVLSLALYAMALFDNATFSISGWSIIEFTRIRNVKMPPETPEDLDHAIYRYLLQYKVDLQKARV